MFADINPRNIKKKMPERLKEECEQRTSQRLHQTGVSFPSDDDSIFSGSGMESEERSSTSGRRRKKVKSGADVRIRPVLKTELWPHTVANETDGEDVNSNDISFHKFLAGYTEIMSNCKGSEALGRPRLLHAISTVFGCMSWPETRLFHNLVMVKLEQGRIKWDADFTILADKYIEQKVRQTLKSKSQGTGNSYRGGNKGQGKGQGNRNSAKGRNNAALSLICFQWNKGSCSFGADCKRWHVCRTCAESGKPGERHKASGCKAKGESQSS